MRIKIDLYSEKQFVKKLIGRVICSFKGHIESIAYGVQIAKDSTGVIGAHPMVENCCTRCNYKKEYIDRNTLVPISNSYVNFSFKNFPDLDKIGLKF